MYCGFSDSCCTPRDLLCVFTQIAIRIYFNHFSIDSFKKNGIKDDNFMKEVLDFLYNLTLYLYKYLPFNLKGEMFQDAFDTHLLCISTQLY